MSEKYNKIRNEEAFDTGDCSVIALRVTTGKTYAEAHAALKQAGRRDGYGAIKSEMIRAATILGFKMTPASIKLNQSRLQEIEEKYNYRVKTLTSKHPKKFPKVTWGKTPELWFSRGHVAGVEAGGEVVDWSEKRSNRIYSIYYVTPI